ncbi:MAG: methylaspartate ammonia-lyase [Steroidobacteraceae bacterium]|jgi:methylaspartate ammonia-lyase|nr:methylaspartate ammonia-lyase [Steroidobacteraceae bacterium]
MRVRDLLFAEGLGAYWYDDQAAIRAGARQEGFRYEGTPLTPGFRTIRGPARALSIGLQLEDGFVAWGDAMTVQYAGAGGREPPFDPAAARDFVERELAPRLRGSEVGSFREAPVAPPAAGGQGSPAVPRALQYGLSQATLAAVAHARRVTRAEVICEEWRLPVVAERVPLFAQSGDERHLNAEKMILKRVDVLPHGLINNREKFGRRGERFAEYAAWVARRVREIGDVDYVPVLHFDLYGTAGVEFEGDVEAIGACLARIESSLQPYRVRIETPFDFGSQRAQIDGFLRLRAVLGRLGSRIELVADEWCDTLEDVRAFARERAAHLLQVKMPDMGSLADSVEAVLECQRQGIGAYLGGSCAETDLSARAAAHVALATRPAMVLAKPGMGVDEGLAIVGNEMSRTVAELRARSGQSQSGGFQTISA